MTIALCVVAMTVAACSSGDPAEPTAPDRALVDRAQEYAVSAQRALEGTAYEALPAADLADLLVDACGRIAASTDPDADVATAVGGLETEAVTPGDAAIMLEVVGIGLSQICPEEVLAAQPTAPSGGGDPEEAYVAVVVPEVAAAAGDEAPSVPVLLDAAGAACGALDAGSSAEGAALAVIEALFDVNASTLPDAEGLVPEWAGSVTGTILGAAVSFVCPEHAAVVADYVSGVQT